MFNMKKQIERELNKELNMGIKEEEKVIYRFSNGQELKYFRNDNLNMNILKLVFHESYFDGISGKYVDSTKDYEITSRDFEGIIEEAIEINKKYFQYQALRRSNFQNSPW